MWAAFLLLARFVFAASGTAPETATLVFVSVWFVVAAVNMWMGVSQAGYSFREELPVFLLIFLLPAVAAALARWQFF